MIPVGSLHGAPEDQSGGTNRVSLVDDEIERMLGAPTVTRDGSSYADLSAKVVDPGLADRQLRLRRVVTYVMAGALGLLVLAAMCGAVRRPSGVERVSLATTQPLEAVPSITQPLEAVPSIPTAPQVVEVALPKSNESTPAESPRALASPPAAAVARARVVATPSAPASRPARTKAVPQQKMRSLSLGPARAESR